LWTEKPISGIRNIEKQANIGSSLLQFRTPPAYHRQTKEESMWHPKSAYRSRKPTQTLGSRPILPPEARGKTADQRRDYAKEQKERLVALGLTDRQARLVIRYVGPTHAAKAGLFIKKTLGSPAISHDKLIAALADSRPSVESTLERLAGEFNLTLPANCPERAAGPFIRALFEVLCAEHREQEALSASCTLPVES
jgi:hypothetical protein